MSNQTWRKYGGMNKLEKMNNITVNSLVTDTFTVRDVASEFQIQALNVTGNSNLSGNIDISGSIYANSLDVLTNVILEFSKIDYQWTALLQGSINKWCK